MEKFIALLPGVKKLYVKDQIVNIFSFLGHEVSGTIIQFCHKYFVNEWVWLRSNKILFMKTGHKLDLALWL